MTLFSSPLIFFILWLLHFQDVIIDVSDVKRHDGVLWHYGHVRTMGRGSVVDGSWKGSIVDVGRGERVIQLVDVETRDHVSTNHTATHLFNAALRLVVGSGGGGGDGGEGMCDQRGSAVDGMRLRFDFALDRPLTLEEVSLIEKRVVGNIQDSLEVHVGVLPLENALNDVFGLRAVFGERYPNPVRVVSVGFPVESLVMQEELQGTEGKVERSVELCGGTHVRNTSLIESFVVVEERGVSKGVRRVTCLTREAAKKANKMGVMINEELEELAREIGEKEIGEKEIGEKEERLREIISVLERSGGRMSHVVRNMSKDSCEKMLRKIGKKKKKNNKEREKKVREFILERLERTVAAGEGRGEMKMMEKEKKEKKEEKEYEKEHASLPIYSLLDDASIDGGVDPKAMRKMLTKILSKFSSSSGDGGGGPEEMLVVARDLKGGSNCYVVCGKHSKLDARDWLVEIMNACGGKGGGKKDFAQGNNVEEIEDVMTIAKETYQKLRRREYGEK